MPHTIGGLKLWLAALKMDDNTPIVLAKDAEGNAFSPLEQVTAGTYTPTSAYVGEIEDGWMDKANDNEDAVIGKPINVAVFWPTN